MTDQNQIGNFGLIGLAIAVLGPLAGPYAVIVLSALAGALWALASTPTPSRLAGGLLLMRLVLTAVVLTGGGAWALSTHYGWSARELLAPLAFVIGMGGNGWMALRAILLAQAKKRLGGAEDKA